MKIPNNHNYDTELLVTNDQVANVLNKFWNHLSIVLIKSRKKTYQCFCFGLVTYGDISKTIKNLDTAKSFQQSDILSKILEPNSDYFAGYSCGNINLCILKSMLSPDLKLADVTPQSIKTNQKNLKIIIGQ